MTSETAGLESLLSVATALVAPEGTLLSANAGFFRLLGTGAGSMIGSDVCRFFVQPSFSALLRAAAGSGGEIHKGLVTIGEYAGRPRALRGHVWRTPEGFRLIAEYDVDEMERFVDAIDRLRRDALRAAGAAGLENAALRQRASELARELQVLLAEAMAAFGPLPKEDDGGNRC